VQTSKPSYNVPRNALALNSKIHDIEYYEAKGDPDKLNAADWKYFKANLGNGIIGTAAGSAVASQAAIRKLAQMLAYNPKKRIAEALKYEEPSYKKMRPAQLSYHFQQPSKYDESSMDLEMEDHYNFGNDSTVWDETTAGSFKGFADKPPIQIDYNGHVKWKNSSKEIGWVKKNSEGGFQFTKASGLNNRDTWAIDVLNKVISDHNDRLHDELMNAVKAAVGGKTTKGGKMPSDASHFNALQKFKKQPYYKRKMANNAMKKSKWAQVWKTYLTTGRLPGIQARKDIQKIISKYGVSI